MIVALKYFSDNSNISVISFWHLLIFFSIQFVIFLVFGVMSDFQFKPGHFVLSIRLCLLRYLPSSDTVPGSPLNLY